MHLDQFLEASGSFPGVASGYDAWRRKRWRFNHLDAHEIASDDRQQKAEETSGQRQETERSRCRSERKDAGDQNDRDRGDGQRDADLDAVSPEGLTAAEPSASCASPRHGGTHYIANRVFAKGEQDASLVSKE